MPNSGCLSEPGFELPICLLVQESRPSLCRLSREPVYCYNNKTRSFLLLIIFNGNCKSDKNFSDLIFRSDINMGDANQLSSQWVHCVMKLVDYISKCFLCNKPQQEEEKTEQSHPIEVSTSNANTYKNCPEHSTKERSLGSCCPDLSSCPFTV